MATVSFFISVADKLFWRAVLHVLISAFVLKAQYQEVIFTCDVCVKETHVTSASMAEKCLGLQ